VLIKPNLVDHIAGRPATTDARLIRALIQLLRQRGVRDAIVADAPAFRKDPLPILDGIGLAYVLADLNVPFVDLNHDDTTPQPLRERFMPNERQLLLPQTFVEADVVISLPKFEDPPLGRREPEPEELVWRAAGRQIRLAQERAPPERHSCFDLRPVRLVPV